MVVSSPLLIAYRYLPIISQIQHIVFIGVCLHFTVNIYDEVLLLYENPWFFAKIQSLMKIHRYHENNYIASSLFGWLLVNDDQVSSQYANNKNNIKIVSLEVYCFQLIMNAKFLTLTIYVNL